MPRLCPARRFGPEPAAPVLDCSLDVPEAIPDALRAEFAAGNRVGVVAVATRPAPSPHPVDEQGPHLVGLLVFLGHRAVPEILAAGPRRRHVGRGLLGLSCDGVGVCRGCDWDMAVTRGASPGLPAQAMHLSGWNREMRSVWIRRTQSRIPWILFGGLGHRHVVLGLSTNGLLAAVSLIVGIILLASAIRSGHTASTVSMTLGALFLLSGLVNSLILGTSLNVLAFRIENVLFSFAVGAVLLITGAYGRVTGRLPLGNPYHRDVPADSPPPTEEEIAQHARNIAAAG